MRGRWAGPKSLPAQALSLPELRTELARWLESPATTHFLVRELAIKPANLFLLQAPRGRAAGERRSEPRWEGDLRSIARHDARSSWVGDRAFRAPLATPAHKAPVA